MSGLASKTVKNFFWNYGSFAVNKIVVFVTAVILARILSPDDFGLLGLALILLEYLERFSRFGIDSAVIYQKGDIEKTTNTAFIIALASGVILTIIAFLSAPFIGAFFDEPRVVPIVQVLSLSLLISNLGSIHQARLMKELDFKSRTVPEVSRAVVKGGVSIVLALMGFGVWSLVWGRIISVLWGTGIYWYIVRWVPSLQFDSALARKLFGYSFHIVLIGLQATIFNNLDYLIIGRQLGTDALGYYMMAYRLPELFIIGMVIIAGQILFPTFSATQDDLATMKKAYLTVLKYVAAFTIPLGLGLMLTANDFVIFAYSDTWQPSIFPTQVLAVYAIVYALAYNTGDVFKALGRPDLVNKLAFVRVLIIVPLLLFAVQFTIDHVAVAQLIGNIIVLFLVLGVIMRFISISVIDIVRAIRAPLASGIVMVGGVIAINALLPPMPIWMSLGTDIIIGGVIYMVMIAFTDRDMITSAIDTIKNRNKKNDDSDDS